MSRHREVQCSRSRAVALIAAGAVTVAAAAAVAAITWTSGPSRSIASPAHEADAGSLLTLSGPVLQMQALQQSTTSQAVQAYQIRDTAARPADADWIAARAATKTAVIRAVTTASRSSAASRPAKKKTASGSPRQIAKAMLASFGWSSGQFSCLDPLWTHESGWRVTAHNAGSGAYGIPQALPGSRMASAGPNWQTNAATQIRWGLEYIKGTYGSPCAAWGHEQATGWY